jgi:hypothetical protein
MSALRDLLEKAERDINTFKHPNVDEAQLWLHNILVAAGLPGINLDSLDHLYIGDEDVCVTTSWSVRSCADSDTYRFPTFIIDAADPIKAARVWGLEAKLEDMRDQLNSLVAQVETRKARIAELEAELVSAT